MKSTVLGIVINFALALIKCSAGLVGHADGLESSADVLSGLAVYFGLRLASKPPDKDHPYGHGKAEPIAAVVVGLSLVAAAAAIMIESIHQIFIPHPIPKPYTLVVLAGVLIVKELLFRHVGSVGDSIGSLAVKSDAWHHRSDAITSAFAFVGIRSLFSVGKDGNRLTIGLPCALRSSFYTTLGSKCAPRFLNLLTKHPTQHWNRK